MSAISKLGRHLTSLLLVFLILGREISPVLAAPEKQTLAQTTGRSASAPAIRLLSTNRGRYTGGRVPRYGKFEITFAVETTARNLLLPYDPQPPPGVSPELGVSVEALFTPDNWNTVYRQPAFLYQDFLHMEKSGQEWIYPTSDFSWKVRFAPDQVGRWQFRLAARDAGGYTQTPPFWFDVVASVSHGFVRVSTRDPRYFEFEDGTYFPALGYNLNYNGISWDNPVLDNQRDFQALSQNGIQLVRFWLSQWGLYGSSWNPWNSPDPAYHTQYIPWASLTFEDAFPGSDVSMQLVAGENPCMFLGFTKSSPAVKPRTTYRMRIRYKTVRLAGPKTAREPYGLVAKTGGWLWGDGQYCYEPGRGEVLTPYARADSQGWQVLEGQFRTGNEDFLPYFYLALENATAGMAYIDRVWMEEDLGGGRYGPNIISSPWMAHHLYVNQRAAFAFDRVVDLAEQKDIYLRLVILEKNDWIFNHLDEAGRPVVEGGNDRFYGDKDQMTKVRWLQQAWWRYLQARWGYTTHIHSWELLNEGDPFNSRHYDLAEAFGRFMHAFTPNDHLVSTSFWHSFPRDEFWANPKYSQVDFADFHQYDQEGEPAFEDTAEGTYDLSMQIGAKQPGGAGKPVLRGEAGFVSKSGEPTSEFDRDLQGLWLHNFIWGQINPGGLVESYWYVHPHILRSGEEGEPGFDGRPIYRSFYNFTRDLPLNNGYYQDAAAQVSDQRLRAWGQKDLVNGQAHLWIQNVASNWGNRVKGEAPRPVSARVSLAGFRPGARYTLQWWDPYQPDPARQVVDTETLTASSNGSLSLEIRDLDTDIAIRLAVASGQ